ncbi:MAG: D-sedoheptulose 7-phosphate isomerase [Bacteroidales bacterium]|jgi:D-sedoheptulose 7-phosphate isomerase
MSNFKEDFLEAKEVLEKFISDEANFTALKQAGNIMANAIAKGNKLISCGNGGSMADAMHFAEELTGQYKEDRRAFPAVSISDPSHITCAANDYGFENIFTRYIEAHGNNGDVLLAISTSGNSKNMINAAKSARQKKMKVVSLTGNDGGKLSELSDVEIRVPHSGYSDRIQEIHIKVIHALINFIEESLV